MKKHTNRPRDSSEDSEDAHVQKRARISSNASDQKKQASRGAPQRKAIHDSSDSEQDDRHHRRNNQSDSEAEDAKPTSAVQRTAVSDSDDE